MRDLEGSDFEDSDFFSDLERGEDLEHASVLIMVTSFLRHVTEADKGLPFTLPTFEAVVPHFWLALARAAAALAIKTHPQDPEGGRVLFDQARRWIHKALRSTFEPSVWHAAAQILMDLGQLELDRDEEELTKEGEGQRLFEEASDYLEQAVKLGPARYDILGDLARSLMVRAFAMEEAAGHRSTLAEAMRRCDEALACFTETNRLFPDGGLHLFYARLLSQAGVIRRLLAMRTEDGETRRTLLQEAFERMRQAATEGDFTDPEALLILGQTALELGWSPGSSQSRHEAFAEACNRFAALAAKKPDDSRVLRDWGSALTGCAAVTSGKEQRTFLAEAEKKLEQAARFFPDSSEPHLDASMIWLRLAGEPSAVAREGASRAAVAARKAGAIEPGSGDYLLACALSRLGQVSEAAEVLAAVLARDPGETPQALDDPDLEALWTAMPDLRRQFASAECDQAEV